MTAAARLASGCLALLLVLGACAEKPPEATVIVADDRALAEAAIQAEMLAERAGSGVSRLLVNVASESFAVLGLNSLPSPEQLGAGYAAVAQAVTDWNGLGMQARPVELPRLRVPIVMTRAETMSEIGHDPDAQRAWQALPPMPSVYLPLAGVFHLSRVGFDAERTVAVVAIERRPVPGQAIGELALFARRGQVWRKLRTLRRWDS